MEEEDEAEDEAGDEVEVEEVISRSAPGTGTARSAEP